MLRFGWATFDLGTYHNTIDSQTRPFHLRGRKNLLDYVIFVRNT